MRWLGSEGNRATFLRLLSPIPNERILDVGAGKGEVAALVQETAAPCEVHILDPDRKSIAQAKKEHPNLKICASRSESIPYEDGSFDKVYSTLAVHHFSHQEKSFGEIARVLKAGGVFVIIDINPRSFIGMVNRFLENTIMRAHLRFVGMDELVAALDREGEFEVKERGLSGPGYFVQAVKKAADAE